MYRKILRRVQLNHTVQRQLSVLQKLFWTRRSKKCSFKTNCTIFHFLFFTNVLERKLTSQLVLRTFLNLAFCVFSYCITFMFLVVRFTIVWMYDSSILALFFFHPVQAGLHSHYFLCFAFVLPESLPNVASISIKTSPSLTPVKIAFFFSS